MKHAKLREASSFDEPTRHHPSENSTEQAEEEIEVFGDAAIESVNEQLAEGKLFRDIAALAVEVLEEFASGIEGGPFGQRPVCALCLRQGERSTQPNHRESFKSMSTNNRQNPHGKATTKWYMP